MGWHESLPKNCPPPEAEPPHGRTFYRLCANKPARSEDFWSQAKSNPARSFAGVSMCILRAISIWDSKKACIEQRKFPAQRNKALGEIVLNKNDGLILKTYGPNHYSWWRSNSFDPAMATILDKS
jgi:hypothetical protein